VPRIWLLVVLIFLQTVLEVLPSVVRGVPWTQPELMEYGGFVLIATVVWMFLGRRSSD
jgi:hypothetical protein